MSEFIPVTLYQLDYPVIPDKYDEGMVHAYLSHWDSHFTNDPAKPRVGDYILTKTGEYLRAAHIWDDHVQTCKWGSFYLANGYASMSGGLDHGFPNENIEPTYERKEGTFWTFHHDNTCAHNGIGIKCACRVFKVI
jgi:hypothetical protein